jgi:ABC-2 type transport system ATP-binding protein
MPERHAVIDVRRLSKTFRVPRQHVMTIKERAMHPFRRVQVDELEALRDVSFQILEGEFFGIVGRNGSGKSTLLKCLAGIYAHDTGSIHLAGRLSPFIELGVGFNSDLTAYDNVVINGVMMGLTPAEARARFDDVMEFAELGDFLDLKLKNYSSGMQVRLAFSVMVQSDADVLLIDEVLAVGDAAFQRKCFDVFYRLRDEGKTIVLVTHDMLMIERFCHRALLLADSQVEEIGDPATVGRRYLDLNFGRAPGEAPRDEYGSEAIVSEMWISGAGGERVDSVPQGERFTINAVVDVHEEIRRPELHVSLETDEGVRAFAANTRETAGEEPPLQPGERVHLRVEAVNGLHAGRYWAACSVHRGPTAEVVTYRGRAADFTSHGGDPDGGLAALDHDVSIERAGARVAP